LIDRDDLIHRSKKAAGAAIQKKSICRGAFQFGWIHLLASNVAIISEVVYDLNVAKISKAASY
jgi:hypothetical protein